MRSDQKYGTTPEFFRTVAGLPPTLCFLAVLGIADLAALSLSPRMPPLVGGLVLVCVVAAGVLNGWLAPPRSTPGSGGVRPLGQPHGPGPPAGAP